MTASAGADTKSSPTPNSRGVEGDGAVALLAVVVPMANERDTALNFLRDVFGEIAAFEGASIITVFDRACTDGTYDLVRHFAETEPRLRVVWAPENRSVVDAYLRGYREALDGGADWILEIDAGYSHAPGDIPRFAAAMREGCDCAFGSRFCAGGRMISPTFSRYVVSRGGTLLTNLLVGTRLSDMTSGFQMFRRGALEQILAVGLRSRGPFFQTEMKVYARHMRVREIPIHYRATESAVRRGSLADALGVLFSLFADRIRGRLAPVAR